MMNEAAIREELDLLRKQLAEMQAKLDRLLAHEGVAVQPAPPAPRPARPKREVSEETLYVLSAAIAAFLGKKAKIKTVRPLGAYSTENWGLQGRVAIMGSHNIRS